MWKENTLLLVCTMTFIPRKTKQEDLGLLVVENCSQLRVGDNMFPFLQTSNIQISNKLMNSPRSECKAWVLIAYIIAIYIIAICNTLAASHGSSLGFPPAETLVDPSFSGHTNLC